MPFRDPARAESQGRSSLDPQGEPALPVDLSSGGHGAAVLQATVLVDEPQPSHAGEPIRSDAPPPSRPHRHLPMALEHQRSHRLSEQEDHDDQAPGVRLPEPAPLQDGRLLLLWRTQPVATLIPEGPKKSAQWRGAGSASAASTILLAAQSKAVGPGRPLRPGGALNSLYLPRCLLFPAS